MSKIGTGTTPIEKVTATEVEATTYTGLPAETVTTLVDNNDNTFTYTSEDATVTNFDSEHTLSEPVADTIRLTKPDGTFDEVTVSGGGGGAAISTTETDTGDTIDYGAGAKTIYSKLVSFGALPNAGTKNVAHGITGLASLVSMDFIFDDGTTYHKGEYHASIQPRTFITSTNVTCVTTSGGFTTFTGYATIFYTKV